MAMAMRETKGVDKGSVGGLPFERILLPPLPAVLSLVPNLALHCGGTHLVVFDKTRYLT